MKGSPGPGWFVAVKSDFPDGCIHTGSWGKARVAGLDTELRGAWDKEEWVT